MLIHDKWSRVAVAGLLGTFGLGSPVYAQMNVVQALNGKTCTGTYDQETRAKKSGALGGASFRFYEKDGALMVEIATENSAEAYKNFATRTFEYRSDSKVETAGNNLTFRSTRFTQQMTYDPAARTLNGSNDAVDFKTWCK